MLIHIGYHKTGSSWLQRFLFSAKARAGFTTFGKGREGPINTLIVAPNALDFDPDRARSQFRELVDEAHEDGFTPVVSSERLSGHPMSGGYDSKELAERLAAVFPEARVLIVIREQREMVLSTYRQYVKAGGAWRLPEFLDPPVDTRVRIPLYDPAHFAYHRLIRAYRRLFGDERVLVLPYEMFRSEPALFVSSIARFASISLDDEFLDSMPLDSRPNLASSMAATGVKRTVNRLVARSDVNPAPLIDAPRLEAFARRRADVVDRLVPGFLAARIERRARDRVAEAVRGRYEDSNRVTSDVCELDLDAYGYTVGRKERGATAGRLHRGRSLPVAGR
jgi:hypothetical protein